VLYNGLHDNFIKQLLNYFNKWLFNRASAEFDEKNKFRIILTLPKGRNLQLVMFRRVQNLPIGRKEKDEEQFSYFKFGRSKCREPNIYGEIAAALAATLAAALLLFFFGSTG